MKTQKDQNVERQKGVMMKIQKDKKMEIQEYKKGKMKR